MQLRVCFGGFLWRCGRRSRKSCNLLPDGVPGIPSLALDSLKQVVEGDMKLGRREACLEVQNKRNASRVDR
jgi:hypothetical protein